nr:MAG TPA: hypothetical protein [Caudoviricetes sp.]
MDYTISQYSYFFRTSFRMRRTVILSLALLNVVKTQLQLRKR